MRKLPEELLIAARRRYGVVTRQELSAGGVTGSELYRATQSGLLVRLAPSAYGVPGLVGPLTAAAAVEAHYPEVVCERRTAAAVWGMDGFAPKPDGAPAPLDLVCDGPRRCQLAPARRRSLLPGDVTERGGLRVTSVERTLLDLGATPGVGPDLLELALESALRANLTSEADLEMMADARGRAAAPLRAVLARRRPGAPPTGSYAETRFLQTVVRPLGLEDPERQVKVAVGRRPEPYRVDFLFRRARGRLAVEIDGAAWHGEASERDDYMRDHYLRRAGVQTLRLDADRVDRRPASARAALRQELLLLASPEP
jgi:very-short-patch-repair endonuclease